MRDKIPGEVFARDNTCSCTVSVNDLDDLTIYRRDGKVSVHATNFAIFIPHDLVQGFIDRLAKGAVSSQGEGR